MKKEKIKNILLMFIFCLITSSLTAYGVSSTFDSSNVCYQVDSNTSASVQDTIDDLYGRASDYSDIDTRLSSVESHFVVEENRFEVGNNLGYMDRGYYIKDSSGVNRSSFLYNNNYGGTSIASYDSTGTWGNYGPLNLYGSSVTINGNEIHALKVQDYTYSNQAISTGSTDISYTLPSGCTLSSVYSVSVLKAWPASNWNNGAIVNIKEVTASTFRLSSTTSQNYSLIIRLVCAV